MCIPGGSKDNGAAARAAEAERLRQERITQGTASIDQAFSGFNDDFYNQRGTAYTDYAMPQLEDKFSEAKKQLNYALARKGLSASTAAADQQRKLAEQYNQFKTDITAKGLDYSKKARSDVESARADLLAQLTATEDPAAAASGAVRRAELLTQPMAFDPISNLVFEIGTGLQDASAAQGYTGVASSPLFSSGSRRVSYVG